MTGFLFELSFWLAAPVWLLMIFAPGWGPTVRIAGSPGRRGPWCPSCWSTSRSRSRCSPSSGPRSAARTSTPSAT
ncbi:abscisic acid-deficient protein Aba4 family protein [Streptomyces acidicola]|uniref:abscisic acid-deficient protein Aba4 family protein n=1 Tax=Streptomyces acidicola TaxID=2596892 RepID=UPI003F4DCCD2